MALNKITKGMSNAAEQIDANFKEVGRFTEDTGWLVLPLESNFKAYSSAGIPMYRRIGDTVSIVGSVTNKTILPKGLNETYVISLLPDIIVPKTDFINVQQGSGMDSFMYILSALDKTVAIGRYGRLEYADAEVGSWINLHATYFI